MIYALKCSTHVTANVHDRQTLLNVAPLVGDQALVVSQERGPSCVDL